MSNVLRIKSEMRTSIRPRTLIEMVLKNALENPLTPLNNMGKDKVHISLVVSCPRRDCIIVFFLRCAHSNFNQQQQQPKQATREWHT
jgi:hypothetical protein